MRMAICYYSGSGNTKLACEHFATRIGTACDLVDIVAETPVDLSRYDLVGMAASADFGGMPKSFESFLARLPEQGGKPAFVLNTYGFMNGRTLADLAEQAAECGFTVAAAHALRMPESYPPMRAIRLGFDGRPNAADLRRFDAFIATIRVLLATIEAGGAIQPQPVRLGMFGALSPARERTTARADMGAKSVDAELCTQCGTCAKSCPYGAITMGPAPTFDMDACFGCWRCYNRCPQHAIYTGKFRGGPYYPEPSEHAREVLGR